MPRDDWKKARDRDIAKRVRLAGALGADHWFFITPPKVKERRRRKKSGGKIDLAARRHAVPDPAEVWARRLLRQAARQAARTKVSRQSKPAPGNPQRCSICGQQLFAAYVAQHMLRHEEAADSSGKADSSRTKSKQPKAKRAKMPSGKPVSRSGKSGQQSRRRGKK